jgi:hypothetical protein
MNFRTASPLLVIVTLAASVPTACGGDSNGAGGDGDSEAGSDQGGSSGKGGSAGRSGAGQGGSSGQGGSAGRGGSSGQGGTAARGGSAGDSGAAGDGGVGANGGAGGDAGEGGAGGAPSCPIADDATVSGTLRITTDDNFRLYVNGQLIDETPRVWSSPQTYTVPLFRNPTRKNVLAVQGINTAEISGLDRGIIADLSFDAGAGAQSVVTDATWRLATSLATNWFTVAFDDSAWVDAIDEGAHGIAPYGGVLGTSSARWIWAYNSNVDAAQKADPPENVWVRKSFYVNLSGAVTGSPSACP